MAQSKVTLLIDTKFQNFEELVRKGKELQDALGVGTIAAEYAALDNTLASILQKINQLKGGGAGGSSTPVITAGHGAKGAGGAGAVGRAAGLEQVVMGAATAAAAGTPGGVLYGPRGEVVSSLVTGRGGGRRATGGLGATDLYSAIRYQAKENVRQEQRERRAEFKELTSAVTLQARATARQRMKDEALSVDIRFPTRPSFGRGYASTDVPIGAEGLRTIRPATRPDPRPIRAREAARINDMFAGYSQQQLAAEEAARLEGFPGTGGISLMPASRIRQAQRSRQRELSRMPFYGPVFRPGLQGRAPGAAAAGAAGGAFTQNMRLAALAGAAVTGATQVGSGVLAGSASPVMGGFGGLAGGGLGFLLGGPLGGLAGATIGTSLGGFFGGGADRAVSMAQGALQFQRQAAAYGAIGGGGLMNRGTPTSIVTGMIGGEIVTRREGGTRTVREYDPDTTGGKFGTARYQVPERDIVTRTSVTSQRGRAATLLGFSGAEALGAYSQATLAGMGSPRNAQDLTRVLELQRSYGVAPSTSGQMLFGLMRGQSPLYVPGTSNLISPLTSLTNALTMGGRISPLEQRSLIQMGGRMFGGRFAETGISPTATMGNVRRFLSGGRGAGFRSQQFAEGGVAYGTRLAAQGPRSPFDFALLSQMTGGGGVSPEDLVSAYTRLEEGGALNPQLLERMLSMTEAAGGGRGTGLSKLLINREMLRKFIPGLGLSRTDDAIRMIREGVPMDEIRGALSVREQGIGVGISGRATQLTTKQMQKESMLKNEMLRIGTEMIDTMQVFKEAAEQMAKNFKEVAPVMAEMNRRIADFSRFVLGGDS